MSAYILFISSNLSFNCLSLILSITSSNNLLFSYRCNLDSNSFNLSSTVFICLCIAFLLILLFSLISDKVRLLK
jgi:hypothetical protein